jgi:hypothetical protein
MIARHHLSCRTSLAFVEQDEVLNEVEQSVGRQHAVEQHFGLDFAFVHLVEALPFGEVVPFAGDRSVAGAMTVADNQECVVMEGMRNDVLVHIVAQIAVKSGSDILVDRLQLDEDQRQTVDKADEIGTAVVVRCAQAGQLQLANSEEVIVARAVVEVDYLCTGVA